jgi:hypothetical protein
MNPELLALTLIEAAETAARLRAHFSSLEISPVEEGNRSEHSLGSPSMEEEALPQASEDTPSGDVSPVSEASAAEPSSYDAGSLAALTKLQIVEQILARQACPPDRVDAETTRLLRLTKSDLISRCLATPAP